MRIFPHYFICFALPLWLVLSKPRRVPCMRFCGYPTMSPRTVKRWGGDSLGALVVFYVVILLVAPFHYAIGRFPYTARDGLRSAPFHYAQDRFPLTARQEPCINCVVERSNQQLEYGKKRKHPRWMLSLGMSYRKTVLNRHPRGILKGAQAPLSALLGTFPAREKYPRVRRDRQVPTRLPQGPEAPAAYVGAPSSLCSSLE